MVISQLNKKLVRDILHIKAQVFSIAMVVGIGVAVFFGFTSTHRSLLESRDQFYRSANFSDIVVHVKKAPSYAVEGLMKISGIEVVETRLEYDALLTLPHFVEPAVGHFVSIPDGVQPKINQLFLRQGRLPSASSTEEVVVSEGFFRAQKFNLGDSFFATLNGRKKSFKIVGVGVTPDYIIALQAGSPLPDNQHFSIIWVNESVLAASFDMRASFNAALVKIKKGSTEEAIIYQIDELLDKYGGIGAYGRNKQISFVYVKEELKQLKVQATFIPIIFFLVAAFILNVVISRLVRVQRDEIATLKALGYYDRDISGLYLKMSSLIVLLGSILGVLMGGWIGRSMIHLYGEFYHFPTLSYDFSIGHVALAIVVSLITAVLGVLSALRHIVRLQPAEAMRPPTPPSYHKGTFEGSPWFQLLKARSRMTVRGITTYPRRSFLTGLGMSLSIVLIIGGLFWQDSMNYLLLAQYSFSQKETGSIQLTQSLSPSAVYEVNRFDGVIESEGYRLVPVKAHFQNREESTSLKGFPQRARLNGVINEKLEEIFLPEGGVYLSRILAQKLGVSEGELIDISVLEGRKPKFSLKVRRIVDSFMSSDILTSRQVIADLMQSEDLVNQILFRSFSDTTDLYTKLKKMPNVLSVTYRDSALKVFNETSATFLFVFAFILSLFAGTIGFGISYNNMRVTFSERDWEMATLRILGFTVPEVFRILISEIIFLVVCFIPVGWVLGYLNARWLLGQMSMDAFQIPFVISPKTFFFATVIIVLSTFISAFFIYRMIKKVNLVESLKARS